MAGQVIIAGFGPSDRVPGPYGDVQYGTSGQSAATLPLFLLLVALKGGAGSLIPDTQVQQIFSKADCDTYGGAGQELAAMGYDAIDTAPNVPIYMMAVTPAGGSVAASSSILFAGSPTGTSTVTVRIDGKPVSYNVQTTDTPSTIATAFAAVINGAYQGRLRVSATASGASVLLSVRTAGARGSQQVLFLDTTQLGSGITATITGNAWITGTVYPVSSYAVPTVANGFYYKVTAIAGTGTSGASQPTWPTTIGTTVVDNAGANQITWTCWGKVLNSNVGQAITMGGGTGIETYTNVLSTLATAQYDRIALAANDATSLAAWKVAIDQQAAAPNNLLQHVCTSSNDLLSVATSAAQTTLNDQRFQMLWMLNAETHPSRIAAAMAATRAANEQADPDMAYNYFALPTVAPMSQKADWPTHAQLVSAINNSVTPLTSNGDGFAKVVRSITTKSVTAGSPDYSTLDTGQAVVPDFVLKDLKLYWSSVFAPANPRVQDNPLAGQRNPPQGVAYPDLWAAQVYSKLIDYSLGVLSGTSATAPPIILAPLPPPVSVSAYFDPVAKRIMCALNITPQYNDAQVGISVRQAA